MITKQSNKLNVYDAPCIKVVSFIVEQGFAGSNFQNVSIPGTGTTSEVPSMESVDQAENNGTLTGFFR